MVQLEANQIPKWYSHYTGISWALETPEFRISLKDSYFVRGWLPHLPSAILGGFPYRKGVQSATIQGSSRFGNGPTQPLVARNPVYCGDMEEYSGEVPLCTYPALVTFFDHCQRWDVGKRDLSFDPYSHSHALTP